MFGFNYRIIIFGRLLATKCISLNNESHKIRPFLIYLNSVELKIYPFSLS